MDAARRNLLGSIAFVAVAIVSTSVVADATETKLVARRPPRPPPPPPTAQTIQWQLDATPSTAISRAQRRTFRLWLVARNVGSAVADTQRDSLEWFVNGQRSMELSMGFGNGGRTNQWAALAPGATVRESRQGAWLVPSAGTFVFSIRMNGREVARRVVTVR